MQSLLKANSLSFAYNDKKWCFKELNFELNKGEVLAILGLNGQGKSTLLNCLIGALKPTSGSIKINATYTFLPQSFSLSFGYSCIDVVIMGRARNISAFSTPSQIDKQIALNAMRVLGIDGLAKADFNSLSGGQKQLVLFARAVASKSDIMFLDEPASALDLKNQDKILTLIQKLKSGLDGNKTSIVFTTHQPSHALAVADKTLILMPDLSYIFGKSKDALSENALKNLYGINIKEIYIDGIKTLSQIFSTQINK